VPNPDVLLLNKMHDKVSFFLFLSNILEIPLALV